MPLIVKDFQWEESDTMLWITVPLKGVKPQKVDIFSSDEYLKVNYSPYLFECFLAGQVDDSKGTAHISNGAVVFKLCKKEAGIWGKVKAPESDDKEFTSRKREEAQKRVQERFEEETKKKAESKRSHEKLAINEMMKIEENERNRISGIKESERQKATDDLERWKEEQRLLAEKEKECLIAAQKMEIEQEKEKSREERKRQKRIRSGNIFEKEKKDGKIPLRENGKIMVTHTARAFPTPVRESQTPQEEEWLKKQAEARKGIQQSLDKDLSPEEQNPQWLRDKGNSFFASGDFKSAINAFTHAIHLTPKLPSLYSNRAACHLKMRNFFKCIEDCSKALDLLHPPVPQNAASRCKALIRRGSAFCQLELYVEGLRDYEGALAIDKNNEAIAKDADRIRQVIQSTAED